MKPEKNKNKEKEAFRTLGIDQPSGRIRLRLWAILAFLVIAAFIAVAAWRNSGKAKAVRYKTRQAELGGLTLTVTATGTLEPTNQVEVGSELSGIIRTVEVNYNDHVKIGQVLARLDTQKLDAQALQSSAALASARAKVLQAQATPDAASRSARRRPLQPGMHSPSPARTSCPRKTAARLVTFPRRGCYSV